LGYPRGLQGEQIPAGASLLAVADAWDVMTLSRPYSAPRSPEEAIAECKLHVGTQFTAAAVAALVRLRNAGELAPDGKVAAGDRAVA
jgi:HD-GYP domain-containing protein (c-di-GMP phosphodiesterase class II)